MSLEGRAGVEHRPVTVDESQPAQACCKCVRRLDASGNMKWVKNFENFQVEKMFQEMSSSESPLKTTCFAVPGGLERSRLLRNVTLKLFDAEK